jgi:hypothetical protein
VTRQNRVLPTGEIAALPFRGAWMGNRGILHDAAGQPGPARWRHKNWICCKLAFKGRKRPLMAPHSYTELFFYDEPQALAAGHRPCAECRREDYNRFRGIWERLFGPADAKAIDAALHKARLAGRPAQQCRHQAPSPDLPDGAMILTEGQPALIWQGALHPWTPDHGYGPARPVPDGPATVLTPAPLVAILAAGYRPLPHPGLTGV